MQTVSDCTQCRRWTRQEPGIGAQGRNRTTDTGIFSPLKPVENSELPSGDVRQAPFKTRQGRYAEARSCTVPFTWFHLFGPDVLLAVDHDRRAIRGRGDRYAAVDASTRRLRGLLWARRVLAVRACRWSR